MNLLWKKPPSWIDIVEHVAMRVNQVKTPYEKSSAAMFMKYAVMRKIATDIIIQDQHELKKQFECIEVSNG